MVSPSDSPSGTDVSTRGTRSRAGNAMGRAHEAALSGAVGAVAKYGSRKATMGDIALIAGIAKATLYNHFRTRDELYAAVLVAEVDAIATAVESVGLTGSIEVTGSMAGSDSVIARCAAMLAEAARLVGQHPAVRKIAAEEPAVLAMLATAGESTAWQLARARTGAALSAVGITVGPAGVDLVTRYLASQLLNPMADDVRFASAALLGAGLFNAATNSGPGSLRIER